MIRRTVEYGKSSIHLFCQNDAHQPMRKGNPAEGNFFLADFFDRFAQSLAPADNEGQFAFSAADFGIDYGRQIFRRNQFSLHVAKNHATRQLFQNLRPFGFGTFAVGDFHHFYRTKPSKPFDVLRNRFFEKTFFQSTDCHDIDFYHRHNPQTNVKSVFNIINTKVANKKAYSE